MTPEKALEILKANEERKTTTNYLRCKHTAIEALEKQIPKKPKSREGTTYSFCPCCDSNNLYEYCGDCGQALDWSDTK